MVFALFAITVAEGQASWKCCYFNLPVRINQLALHHFLPTYRCTWNNGPASENVGCWEQISSGRLFGYLKRLRTVIMFWGVNWAPDEGSWLINIEGGTHINRVHVPKCTYPCNFLASFILRYWWCQPTKVCCTVSSSSALAAVGTWHPAHMTAIGMLWDAIPRNSH